MAHAGTRTRNATTDGTNVTQKLQNYFVKDPKLVNGRKRMEIEDTSNNEKKESKSIFNQY